MTWETVDVNVKSKVIFVKRVPGISVVDWDVKGEIDIHTVVAQKIRSILETDDSFPYLSESCSRRLAEIRYITRNSGILQSLVTPLSGKKFAVFPWVGTRQMFTLHYALSHKKIVNRLPWMTCPYLETQFDGTAKQLEESIFEILSSSLNMYDLPLPEKVQVLGKYNEFIPQNLLRKQFIEDYLDFEGLKNSLPL
jgi:ATP-dependent Lhr-like helicase